MPNIKSKLFTLTAFVAILLGGIRLVPWNRVNWGKIEMLPGSAITVTGEAKEDVLNQIASFTASVTVSNDDKQIAVDEVNQKMTAIIKAVKDFGIDELDLKTQNVSVYETKEPIRIQSFPVNRQARWQANNSLQITLRDVDKASQLTDLLSSLETTSVSGPRLTLDDTTAAEAELLKSAIDNARDKAEILAKASNRKLGKVLSVSEAGSARPGPIMLMEARLDDSAPIEPGTSRVQKTVTVIFELN